MLNAKIFQTKCKQTPATMTGDFCSYHCIGFYLAEHPLT